MDLGRNMRALYDAASSTTYAVAQGVGAVVSKQIAESAVVNPHLGRVLTIGKHTVRIKAQLAEGGYSFVYSANDTLTDQQFALKRMVCQDKDMMRLARNEISMLERLPDHPNVVRFYGKTEERRGNATEVFVLLELCPGGHLVGALDQRQRVPVPENEIWAIFEQICAAVCHLHSQSPPIVHRDLKIENVLLANGKYKLCDFGSCIDRVLHPTCRRDILEIEEEIQRMTTLAYRSPEMVDLYQMHPIDTKADVWALGCILFRLAFFDHPFDDGANLKIINAAFSIPSSSRYSSALHGVIRSCLVADPALRPTTSSLLQTVHQIRKGNTQAAPSLPVKSGKQPSSKPPALRPSSGNTKPQEDFAKFSDTTFFDPAPASSSLPFADFGDFESAPKPASDDFGAFAGAGANQWHQVAVPQNATSHGFDDFADFVAAPPSAGPSYALATPVNGSGLNDLFSLGFEKASAGSSTHIFESTGQMLGSSQPGHTHVPPGLFSHSQPLSSLNSSISKPQPQTPKKQPLQPDMFAAHKSTPLPSSSASSGSKKPSIDDLLAASLRNL
eukprot:c17714_g1_i1.p1 GENE.c17714_g1_i1~~c17714_g1_i1.p1  ORF type:complete len:572 (-),score=102.57 c17714_g1_i1:224-1897(-)